MAPTSSGDGELLVVGGIGTGTVVVLTLVDVVNFDTTGTVPVADADFVDCVET